MVTTQNGSGYGKQRKSSITRTPFFIFEIDFKVSVDLIDKNFWMHNLEIIHHPQTDIFSGKDF